MPEAAAKILSSEWLTTEETMTLLGIARRTVQEWAQSGFLHWKFQSVPGRKPERVYQRSEVENFRQHGPPKREQAARPKKEIALRQPKSRANDDWDVPIMAEIAIAMTTIAKHLAAPALPPAPVSGPAVRLSEKVWLSLDEAAEYSGLAKNDLLRLCQEADPNSFGAPSLVARKSGGWKIQRKSLEAFDG
jgi:hypothetical protein